MDKIFIRNLQVSVQVGILPHEKAKKQKISFDIVYSIDAKRVSQFDEVASTIDYGSVREILIHFLNSQRFNLIETLADQCADCLLMHFKMKWLKLSVTKSSIFDDADGVGIIIERNPDNSQYCP